MISSSTAMNQTTNITPVSAGAIGDSAAFDRASERSALERFFTRARAELRSLLQIVSGMHDEMQSGQMASELQPSEQLQISGGHFGARLCVVAVSRGDTSYVQFHDGAIVPIERSRLRPPVGLQLGAPPHLKTTPHLTELIAIPSALEREVHCLRKVDQISPPSEIDEICGGPAKSRADGCSLSTSRCVSGLPAADAKEVAVAMAAARRRVLRDSERESEVEGGGARAKQVDVVEVTLLAAKLGSAAVVSVALRVRKGVGAAWACVGQEAMVIDSEVTAGRVASTPTAANARSNACLSRDSAPSSAERRRQNALCAKPAPVPDDLESKLQWVAERFPNFRRAAVPCEAFVDGRKRVQLLGLVGEVDGRTAGGRCRD
eukprot:6186077-Pleurochrysis_carterae.AAC.1